MNPMQVRKKARELTLQEIADALNTDPANAGRIIRGEQVPGPARMVSLSKILKMPIDKIVVFFAENEHAK